MEGQPLEDFHDFIDVPEIMELKREDFPEEDLQGRYEGSLGYGSSPDSSKRSQIA